MIKKTVPWGVVLFGLLLGIPLVESMQFDSFVFGQANQVDHVAVSRARLRAILEGLQVVNVRVGWVGDSSNYADKLKVAIELRLQEHGIRVSDDKEIPKLHCIVGGWEGAGGTISGTASVELYEQATLKREEKVAWVRSWYSADTGMAKSSQGGRANDTYKQWILEGVDEFINDYLAANPKQP